MASGIPGALSFVLGVWVITAHEMGVIPHLPSALTAKANPHPRLPRPCHTDHIPRACVTGKEKDLIRLSDVFASLSVSCGRRVNVPGAGGPCSVPSPHEHFTSRELSCQRPCPGRRLVSGQLLRRPAPLPSLGLDPRGDSGTVLRRRSPAAPTSCGSTLGT